LKTHPFFNGIDFAEVSNKKYKGLKELVMAKQKEFMTEEEILHFEASNQPRSSMLGTAVDSKQLVLKGNLLKINWYGSKQLRFFELFSNGELKYY